MLVCRGLLGVTKDDVLARLRVMIGIAGLLKLCGRAEVGLEGPDRLTFALKG